MASTHKQIMQLVSGTLGKLFTDAGNPTLVHWKFGRHSWETEDRTPPVVGWVPDYDEPTDSYRTQGIPTTCGGAKADVIASFTLWFNIYLWALDPENDINESEKLRNNVYLAARNATTGSAILKLGRTDYLSQKEADRYQKKMGIHGGVSVLRLGFVTEAFDVLQELTTIVTASVDVTGSFPVTGSAESIGSLAAETTGSISYIGEPVVRVTALSGSS